jgi:putative oxidoreductase
VVGSFGELFFPVLLVLGLGGRVAPLGLFAVNLMAVISYANVLLAEGFEAALAQHVLWGFMLVLLTVFGQGALSADRLLGKPLGATRPW